MRAHTGIRFVFRWFFPAVLAFTVAFGLVGDRRVSANLNPFDEDFAVQIPAVHALLADQVGFESLSSMLDYNSLWDFCVHQEGQSIVPVFSFAGKEPHTTRFQTMAFTVSPDQSLPGGYRIEGPRHGFNYLTGDLPPVAPDRKCLKILRAALGDETVVAKIKTFLEFWPIESISVESVPESSNSRLTIRSPSDGGSEPHTLSWRVEEWSDSSYSFIAGND